MVPDVNSDQPPEPIYNTAKTMRKVIVAVVFGLILVTGVMLALRFRNSDTTTSDEWLMPMFVMGGMFLFAILMLVIVTVLGKSGEKANVQRVLQGPHWDVWQYTPDEWRQYVEAERQDQMDFLDKTAIFRVSFAVSFALLLLVIFGAGGFIVAMMPEENRLLVLAIIGVVGILTTLLVVTSNLGAPGKVQKQIQAQYHHKLRVPSPRVYFTEDGMYTDYDGYHSLRGLVDAEYVSSQPIPVIRLTTITGAGKNRWRGTVILPVPRGKESQAAALIERYHRERL